MKYQEAVDLRARQLAGDSIAPMLVAEAIAVIKAGRPRLPPGRKPLSEGPPLQLLEALANGPMLREDFYAMAVRIYTEAGRKLPPYQRISQMMNEGWLVDEIRLTDAGRSKITVKTGALA